MQKGPRSIALWGTKLPWLFVSMATMGVIWARNKTVWALFVFIETFYCFIVLTPFCLFLSLMMSYRKLSAVVAEGNGSLSQTSGAQPSHTVFRSLKGSWCLCCYPTWLKGTGFTEHRMTVLSWHLQICLIYGNRMCYRPESSAKKNLICLCKEN